VHFSKKLATSKHTLSGVESDTTVTNPHNGAIRCHQGKRAQCPGCTRSSETSNYFLLL